MSELIQNQTSAPIPKSQPVILTSRMSVPAAVQKIIQHQNATLTKMLPVALRGNDIEGVHKVRVSLRRMRTCLKVTRAYFQRKNLAATRIDLKFVRQVFGRVRDMDVFREKFSLFLSEIYSEEDFESLIWHPVFDQTYQDYTAQIRSPVTQDIIKQLGDTLAEFETSDAVLKKTEKLASLPVNLRTFLPLSMKAQLSSIHDFKLGQEEDRQYPRHHQLRLLIKAHRYTYEFFQSVLDQDASSAAIKNLIKVQDHLGELNDSVESIRLLRTHQSPRLSSDITEVLKSYIQFQRENQPRLIDSFPAIWDQFLETKPDTLLSVALAQLQG